MFFLFDPVTAAFNSYPPHGTVHNESASKKSDGLADKDNTKKSVESEVVDSEANKSSTLRNRREGKSSPEKLKNGAEIELAPVQSHFDSEGSKPPTKEEGLQLESPSVSDHQLEIKTDDEDSDNADLHKSSVYEVKDVNMLLIIVI